MTDVTQEHRSGAGEPVQDTWFTDSSLPIMAMSADVESDRVLRLFFRRAVSDDDRKALVDALNLYQASLASPAKAGEREEHLRRERDKWRTTAVEWENERIETSRRARRMEEALREAQERFASIDCATIGQMHNTTPAQLLGWCKAIASHGFDETSAALSDSPASAARPAVTSEMVADAVSTYNKSTGYAFPQATSKEQSTAMRAVLEAALSQSAPASMNGTQGEAVTSKGKPSSE